MKKIILITAVGIAAASPLASQAEGGYVDLALGKAKTSSDIDNSAITTVSRSNGLAYQLDAGYEFNRFFGVELGYADLGPSSDTLNTTDVFKYHFTSYYLAGTGTVPMGAFSLFGKLGVSSNRIAGRDDFGASSTPYSGGKVDMMGGVGAGIEFTKNIGIRLQYEYFGKVTSSSAPGGTPVDNKGRGEMLSLGLRLKF
jgi:OOP family OmpA-OmpF porin